MLLGFIDIRVLYIMIISAAYGARRAALATVLSIILLVYEFYLYQRIWAFGAAL